MPNTVFLKETCEMAIKKAVIPAAGLGTRVLPASKALPKEMLPIVDKPAIQYIVEEAVNSGITDILIITNRGKSVIEDHFDHSFELESNLRAKGRNDTADELSQLAHMANIYFLRQKETKGLGHAVLQARSFIGNEPFAVLYGDDVIISEKPVTKQLCEVYDNYGKGVAGIKPCSREQIKKYCSLGLEPVVDMGKFLHVFEIFDMVEKPTEEQIMSLYAILGRCILPPEIFDILEQTAPGTNGEIQLTDAMATLSRTTGMMGIEFEGTRYDMGNKFGIMKAQVEVALKHPEISGQFKEYIKEIAKTLD